MNWRKVFLNTITIPQTDSEESEHWKSTCRKRQFLNISLILLNYMWKTSKNSLVLKGAN